MRSLIEKRTSGQFLTFRFHYNPLKVYSGRVAHLGERHPYTMDVVGSNPSVGTTKSVRRRSGRHPIPTTPLAAGQEYKDSAADKTTMIDKHARSAVYVVISCLLHLGKVDALQC